MSMSFSRSAPLSPAASASTSSGFMPDCLNTSICFTARSAKPGRREAPRYQRSESPSASAARCKSITRPCSSILTRAGRPAASNTRW